MPPVDLTIDSFDYFNHGEDFKTIYARVRSTPATSMWFKELKKHLHVKEFMVPHITICRNIPTTDFNKLWPHFKSIKWDETFTINALTILQRETFASFANWELHNQLSFEGRLRQNIPLTNPSLIKSVKESPIKNQQISLF